MRIHEAARVLGISPDWLRKLERLGKIPAAPRDLAGHRRYPHAYLVQLRTIILDRGASDGTARRSLGDHQQESAAGGIA